jgi:hypothetical protein
MRHSISKHELHEENCPMYFGHQNARRNFEGTTDSTNNLIDSASQKLGRSELGLILE